tara:strand:- start:22 stop:357 length:336 start_codon:yes stop_codon:yes gene_type:complete
MLSTEQRNTIAQQIHVQMKALKAKIIEYKELTKPIPPENAIGRVSRMDAINNKSVNEAALRIAEQKYINMGRALEKIDLDYFGLCTGCGKEIPVGRIMLMPGSTKCVKCAS